jgi:hypothetical protein
MNRLSLRSAAAIGTILLGAIVAVSVPSTGQSPVETASVGFLWTHQIGSAFFDQAVGIAADASGVYVVGTTGGALRNETSQGGDDAFVTKYDAAGNEVWIRQFGTSSNDQAVAVAADLTGVYVAGGTAGTLPGQTSAGSVDALLRRYDANGSIVWTRQFGTPSEDFATAVAVGASGVFIAGHTRGTLPLQTTAGGADAFLQRYDGEGNIEWTRQFGTPLSDYAFAVASDSSGAYVAGTTGGSLPNQTSAGGEDAFLRAYDAAGAEIWTRQFGTSSADNAFAVAICGLGVYVAGSTYGSLPGQSNIGFTDAFLRAYDIAGAERWTRQLGTSADDAATTIGLDPSGVYVVGRTFGTFPGQVGAGGYDDFIAKYGPAGVETALLQFGTVSSEFAATVAVGPSGMYIAGATTGAFPGQTNPGSADVFIRRAAETPAPPLGITAAAGDNRVHLSWSLPGFEGHAPVDGYRVYRGTNPATVVRIADLGDVRIYTDPGVTNGVDYFYQIASLNPIGEGVPSVTVATTPRGPPSLTITSPTDETTNNSEVTVAGTAEADSTVTIAGTGVPVGIDGTFGLTLTLADGTHVIEILATNPIGETTSVRVTIIVDTVSPALILVSPVDRLVTASSTILVAGTTDVGAMLGVNGLVVDLAADGSFSFRLPLAEGENLLTATARDAAGNEAKAIRTVTYVNPVAGLEEDLEDARQSIDKATATSAELSSRSFLLLVLLLAVVGAVVVQSGLYLDLRKRMKETMKTGSPAEPESPRP